MISIDLDEVDDDDAASNDEWMLVLLGRNSEKDDLGGFCDCDCVDVDDSLFEFVVVLCFVNDNHGFDIGVGPVMEKALLELIIPCIRMVAIEIFTMVWIDSIMMTVMF